MIADTATYALPTAAELARIYAAGLTPAEVLDAPTTCATCADAEPTAMDGRYLTDAHGRPVCEDCAADAAYVPDVDPNDPETRGVDPDALHDYRMEDAL